MTFLVNYYIYILSMHVYIEEHD